VGGLIVVVVVVGTDGDPGVLPGVKVVVVSLIGVPFLRPLTTALEFEPRKELNSSLIFPMTLLSPWSAVRVFILAASLFKSEVVWLNPSPEDPNTKTAAKNIPVIFIMLPPFI
jgi:hypothetical protein